MRERALVAALALVLAPMLALGALAATTPETTDYLCFWAGARLVLDGRDPYAQAEWNSVTVGVWVDALGRTRPGNCSDRFAYPYPLTTAVAMLPLGALPLYVGAAIWELWIFIGAGVGLLLLARAAKLDRLRSLILALLVVSSEMFYRTVLNAQFGGFNLLTVGLLAAPTLGPARATIGLTFAALKPHTLALVPLVRIASLSRRTILTALAFGGLLLVASLALRRDWLTGWAGDLDHRREMFDSSVSLWTLERAANASGLAIAVTILSLATLGVAWWRAHPLTPLHAIAIAALAWQLVVPYGLSYDQIAPLTLTAAVVLSAARNRATTWALSGALVVIMVLLPWLLYLRKDLLVWRGGGLEVLNAIVPVAATLLLAGTLLIPRCARVRQRRFL